MTQILHIHKYIQSYNQRIYTNMICDMCILIKTTWHVFFGQGLRPLCRKNIILPTLSSMSKGHSWSLSEVVFPNAQLKVNNLWEKKTKNKRSPYADRRPIIIVQGRAVKFRGSSLFNYVKTGGDSNFNLA